MSELPIQGFAPVEKEQVKDLFHNIMEVIDHEDTRVVHVALALSVVNVLKQTGMTLGNFIDGCIVNWDKVNPPPEPPEAKDIQ